jgi:hypothetical protein
VSANLSPKIADIRLQRLEKFGNWQELLKSPRCIPELIGLGLIAYLQKSPRLPDMLQLHTDQRGPKGCSSVVREIGIFKIQALDQAMMHFHLKADVVLGVEHEAEGWRLGPHPLVRL